MPAIGAMPMTPLTAARATAIRPAPRTDGGSSSRMREITNDACALSSATMAIEPVTRQKVSPSISAQIAIVTSTKLRSAATMATPASTGSRAATVNPAAAKQEQSVKRIAVALTRQSVSLNSPLSSAIHAMSAAMQSAAMTMRRSARRSDGGIEGSSAPGAPR